MLESPDHVWIERHLEGELVAQRAEIIFDILRRMFPLRRLRLQVRDAAQRWGSRFDDDTLSELRKEYGPEPQEDVLGQELLAQLIEAYGQFCVLAKAPKMSLEFIQLGLVQREWEAQFKEPEAKADMAKWAKPKFWTNDQAAMLSVGLNPDLVTRSMIQQGLPMSPMAESFERLREHIRLAAETGEIGEPNIILPGAFLRWCEGQGWELPPLLLAAVKIAEQDEVRRTEDEEDDYASYVTHAKPTSSSTYKKMILALAIQNYGFNPSFAKGVDRTSTFNEIAGVMESMGLGADRKTVSNALIDALDWAKGKCITEKQLRPKERQGGKKPE